MRMLEDDLKKVRRRLENKWIGGLSGGGRGTFYFFKVAIGRAKTSHRPSLSIRLEIPKV